MIKIPPKRQLRATQLLLEEGLKLGYLARDYKLYAHRQLDATQSPGDELYEIIRKWPHWSSIIIDT